MFQRRSPALLGMFLLIMTSFVKADEVKIIASIKPLQLIAAALVEGISEPMLLVPVGASPHGYALRPSDLERLQQADVVFWVGPEMEPFLQKLMSQPRKGAIVRDFSDLSEESESLAREHSDSEEDHQSSHHEHSHAGHDPHIWLDPDKALAMAKMMATVLIERDVANKARYISNLEAFEQRLEQALDRNREQLQRPRDRAIFVFHDAYGHLADYYGLEIKGVVTLSPELQSGTRHLVKLRETLQAAGKSCLFTEPQFHSAMLARLIDGQNVKLAELDPLASAVPLYPDGYIRHQELMISTIVACTESTTQ